MLYDADSGHIIYVHGSVHVFYALYAHDITYVYILYIDAHDVHMYMRLHIHFMHCTYMMHIHMYMCT